MLSNQRLLTEDEAAKNLRVSSHTLKRWRHNGKGPTYVQMGRTIRYRETDVFEFVKRMAKEHPAVFKAAGCGNYEPRPWACQIEGEHTHPEGKECRVDMHDMPPHVPPDFKWPEL